MSNIGLTARTLTCAGAQATATLIRAFSTPQSDDDNIVCSRRVPIDFVMRGHACSKFKLIVSDEYQCNESVDLGANAKNSKKDRLCTKCKIPERVSDSFDEQLSASTDTFYCFFYEEKVYIHSRPKSAFQVAQDDVQHFLVPKDRHVQASQVKNVRLTTSHVLCFLLHLQVQCHHLSASRVLISFSAYPKTPLERSHAEVLPNAYQRAIN